ncbi:monovalent cation/H+ antiporter subunit E [Natrononativus amylolyticus]|uniref:monovalent cation/H+ antiporter subunit E n=1 Tax=Natrononativus amylolyticus TaxID=2963434 RepID=UPI0020CD520A|nr:monovalent cation/H+ antiporter subunit E [Natrononativus amylolyticus]
MATERVLVPLSESITVRQTVSYAVRSRVDDATDTLVCHLVVAIPYDAEVPEGQRTIDDARQLLDRAERWVREDAGNADVEIETAVLGTDEYLFGPRDYADALAAYAEDHDLDCVVLDPEYSPGATAPILRPLERELTDVGLTYEEAPVERSARHERLVGTDSPGKLVALFGISLGFYLVLGDPFYWFDWVTGVAVAGIVSLTLSNVTFATSPTIRYSPVRTLRFGLYVPYLIFEIIKSNLQISLVILRPSMPIEPTLTRVNTKVRSGLPLLALANSITLTPGTLVVRANDQRLVVHTLIVDAREGLFDGALERAVRFVFYGREAAAVATPRERGDTEIIGGDEL